MATALSFFTTPSVAGRLLRVRFPNLKWYLTNIVWETLSREERKNLFIRAMNIARKATKVYEGYLSVLGVKSWRKFVEKVDGIIDYIHPFVTPAEIEEALLIEYGRTGIAPEI